MYEIDLNVPSHVYFIGIGGIGMSGLAEYLHQAGFTVSGSDRTASALTRSLEAKGITVKYGESAGHVTADIDCAVLTSAVKDTNLEFQAIREMGIPWMTRAQLLGQWMKNYEFSVAVSGTHGKTTTTSMISEILLGAGADPTLSIGGMLKSIGGNVRIGSGPYFVTEADEYTNSFLSLSPTIGIILNIDADHPDFFKDLEDTRHSFRKFAERISPDGFLIINADVPNHTEITKGLSCKVVTFSLEDASADYFPSGITYGEFGQASFVLHGPAGREERLSLTVPGLHNVSNALAAMALADCLGFSRDTTVKSLAAFSGTDRRFEYKGSLGGITIIDDYAHHPTEITATLSAAQKYPHKTLWCVFQPHTYSRTKVLMKDFAKALALADRVVLADIFPARETDDLGISSADLCREIQALGRECHYFATFDEIENFLLKNCIKDDLLITMGAGDILKVGEALLGP